MAIVDGCLDDPGSRTQFIVEFLSKGTDEKVYLGTGFQVKMIHSLLRMLWPADPLHQSHWKLVVMSHFSFSALLKFLPGNKNSGMGHDDIVMNWR